MSNDKDRALQELRTTLRREYEAGEDLRTLAAKYGGSKSTIRRYILAAGGTMRRQGSSSRRIRRGGILSWLDN